MIIKITVCNDNGTEIGPPLDLVEVPSQLAALEMVMALLTLVGTRQQAQMWGNPQLDALSAAIVKAQPLARHVRIMDVKPVAEADVVLVGNSKGARS